MLTVAELYLTAAFSGEHLYIYFFHIVNTDYEARAANLEISMIMQRAVCIALKDFDSLGLFLSYRSKVHILFLVWNKPPIFMGVDFSYCLKNQYRDNYIRFNLFIFNL